MIKKLANALKNHKIPYMIIGGQAALLYREPRFTNDIDITLGIGIEKIKDVLHICNEINLRVLIENPEEFASQTMVLPAYDDLSKMRVDFIFSFTQYETEAIGRANIIQIDGCDVAFCSLEDLIILKVFAGRAIDLEDVAVIIRKNPDYNRILVELTLIELGKTIDTDLVSRLTDIELKNK